jgi:CTP synthase
MTKYIFITGGVLSSLGKGIAAASIGALLESMGYKITFLKLDPYLNIDPGTMNPYQHGEVFVTDDGAETDLDIGHYERFTQVTLHKRNSVTAGKLYAQLLDKERRGEFLGGTIQTVPHFTDEIKAVIKRAAEGESSDIIDFTIVEIGGTVGDIESLPFIEAIRQMGLDAGRERCLYIHLTYVPYINVAGELKTKPTQHSVKELRSLGIQPDVLICRATMPITLDIKKKIALFTNVKESSIISAPDLSLVYELPLYLQQEGLHMVLLQHFKLPQNGPDLVKLTAIIERLKSLQHTVTIAIVGKYIDLKDAYKSISESLAHAQIPTDTRITIAWINAEDITHETVHTKLQQVDGILVPGGFGDRGIAGKLHAIRYARERKIPFFGICLGMQLAVVEFARNVLGLADAHSTEFVATKYPVVDLMVEQKQISHKGGTMRLGAQICKLLPDSKAHQAYGMDTISERHRHRYEVNAAYVPAFYEAGLIVSGTHEAGVLPEIVELKQHPYFVACQFHPELKSKLFVPHPLFVSFIDAVREKSLSS